MKKHLSRTTIADTRLCERTGKKFSVAGIYYPFFLITNLVLEWKPDPKISPYMLIVEEERIVRALLF